MSCELVGVEARILLARVVSNMTRWIRSHFPPSSYSLFQDQSLQPIWLDLVQLGQCPIHDRLSENEEAEDDPKCPGEHAFGNKGRDN